MLNTNRSDTIMSWNPTPRDKERRRRMQVSLWAYAYEVHSDSMVSDEVFDKVSLEIDVSTPTGNTLLDNFFKEHFDPDTGIWIYEHPEEEKLEDLYQQIANGVSRYT